MRLGRHLGVVAVAAIAAFASLVGPRVVARADDANHECDNNNDITVVIDFQELGGGVNVRCAPQPVTSGFDAFHRADIAVDNYNGFVCRIAGAPEAGPCDRYPPASAYWVYWLAQRGGAWCPSNYGAGPRTPPPGTVEGWSYAKNKSSSALPPPRYPVPAAIPGDTPHPLNDGDCTDTMSPPTTARPRVTAPPATDAPLPTTLPGSTVTDPPVSGGSTATTPTPVGSLSTATTTEDGVPATTMAATVDVASITTSSIPLGDVDLSKRRSAKHDKSSSPIGVIAAVIGIAAIVLGGRMMRTVHRGRRGLASRRLTYAPVGLTTTDSDLTSSGRVYEGSSLVGYGPEIWSAATRAVLDWEVKTRSGFAIEDEDSRLATEVRVGRVWLIAKIGPLRIREPIEVVSIVDEPDRVGYAYGTLNGHPVTGEESFIVDKRTDESVWLTVRSVTWPASGRWRLATPVVRLAQRVYRRRYLRSLTD